MESVNIKRTSLVVFLVLLMSVMALTAWMVLPYLLAVTMGGILALLFQPVYQWLKSHHLTSRIAAFVVTCGVVVLVLAPLAFFVTKAIQQGMTFGHSLAEGGYSLRSLTDRISGWGPIGTVIGSPDVFERQSRRWIQGSGAGATAVVFGVAANLPGLILQLALSLLACFFLLVDGHRFLLWVSDKIPLDADVRAKVVDSFKNTAISAIWATLAAGMAQSVVIGVSFLILGIPAAFLAAGATFFFAWIPLVGCSPVWIVGALYLYLQGMAGKAILMITFGLLAGIVDNFVRPLVLKGRSDMHPLVSLVAIFGGIGMFGLMGVFVGPVLAAVLISLLQVWPAVGTRSGLLSKAPSGARAVEDGHSQVP